MISDPFYKDHWINIDRDRLDRYQRMFLWLGEHGFERYAELSEENGIDGEVLFDLANDDL